MIAAILALLAMSAALAWWQLRFFAGKVLTWGTVAELPHLTISAGDEEGGGTIASVIITFTDQAGAHHRHQSDFGERNPGYAGGQAVLIFYDPKRPQGSSGILDVAAHFGVAYSAAYLALMLAQARILLPLAGERIDSIAAWTGATVAFLVPNLVIAYLLWLLARRQFVASLARKS